MAVVAKNLIDFFT